MEIERYPRVVIQYCSKCKWQNRAVWYMSEILQTFEGLVNDVSLQPIIDQPGAFQIIVQKNHDHKTILYKRRFKSKELAIKYGDVDGSQLAPYYYDGFPDSKLIKVLLKDLLDDKVELGHAQKYSSTMLLNGERNQTENTCSTCNNEE